MIWIFIWSLPAALKVLHTPHCPIYAWLTVHDEKLRAKSVVQTRTGMCDQNLCLNEYVVFVMVSIINAPWHVCAQCFSCMFYGTQCLIPLWMFETMNANRTSRVNEAKCLACVGQRLLLKVTRLVESIALVENVLLYAFCSCVFKWTILCFVDLLSASSFICLFRRFL